MKMKKHEWMLIILIILSQLWAISLASSTNANSSTDEWAMFRHDASRRGYTTGSSPTDSVKLLWTYKTGASIQSSPAVANGYVFVGCMDWNVYWLNASNGEIVWHFQTGNEVNSSPAISNGSLYVGSDDGNVYCLDIATGARLWMSAVGGSVRSSPIVVEGRVYVGSGDHDLLCLGASDGAEILRYPTAYRVQSSPAVADGVVYFASDDFHVYAVNASTGDEIWRTHTGSYVSSPSVCNGYVYIGSIDSYVCGLNASTGAKIWKYQTENSIASSPAVAYGCVYVGADDNNVYCLNATNGEKIWQSPTGYWVRSSPAVVDGNVYVGSEDYSIYCFDAFTGEKKWSYAVEGQVDSSPAIVDGTLYVGSHDYHVYAFALGDSIDALPSQYTHSLTWATIVFDAIACVVAAAFIFVMVRFIRTDRLAKRNTETIIAHGKKASWFSAHADALCALAILAFSTIFFVNLGTGPLWVADEQTYSQWAFYMVKTGDYLNPWAFGELALWVGKPPLFMWLMSLAYQVFGVNNFATRFWSPVFGVLSLVLVFYLGKNLYNRTAGFLSAIVLGTFTTFYLFARHAMTDVPFIFFILASLYFLVLNEKTEDTNRYAVLSGLFFGLALMTKQIIALLIPLIAFAYFAATKRSIRFLFTKRFTLFWAVGLLTVVPWVIYMTLQFGLDFWQIFLVYSNITRAVIPIEGHAGSYLYYFSYLINNETVLWAMLLPFAAGLCVFNAFFKRSKEDSLILVWMATVLLTFTFAQTKLHWYILPAFPAFALAIGNFLHQALKKIQETIGFLAVKAQETFDAAKSWKKRRQLSL
jgi:outer membrane protein assembly factor BamB